MSRACIDCGIPPWSDCVCDDAAGLDHPHLPIVVPNTHTFTVSTRVHGSALHPKGRFPREDPEAIPPVSSPGRPCACVDHPRAGG